LVVVLLPQKIFPRFIELRKFLVLKVSPYVVQLLLTEQVKLKTGDSLFNTSEVFRESIELKQFPALKAYSFE